MPRLGEALRAAVAEGFEAEAAAGPPRSVLMHPQRRRLFEELCLRPGTHPAALARALNVSLPTVNWHVQKMKEEGLVAEARFGNRRALYPEGMLGDGELLRVAAALQAKPLRSVYAAVVATPGLSQRELADRRGLRGAAVRASLVELRALGLLTAVADGRYRRHFPTAKLQRLEDANRAKLRAFRRRLVRRLERERLRPQAHFTRTRALEIVVEVGGRRDTLRVPETTVLHLVAREETGR